MQLIGARSARAAGIALNHLGGGLGRTVAELLERVLSVSAQLEAGLDFPDEDLPAASIRSMTEEIADLELRLGKLRDSFELGAALTSGARVAIVGPPNAGKSSLLNRLVSRERALVDPAPGTTRDVVEASGEVAGVPVTFLDTAGLRKGGESVERLGMERTRESMGSADVVVAVLDCTVAGAESFLSELDPAPRNLIVAANKRDLPGWRAPTDLASAPLVPTSALTGEGVDALLEEVARQLGADGADEPEVLTSERQRAAIASCADHLDRGRRLMVRGADHELAADELRHAREELADLTGRAATEEMLDSLFERFCVGK
jgi:tRNA modification GTPase